MECWSSVEEESLEIAKEILKGTEIKLLLPIDVVISDEFSAAANNKIIPIGDIPENWRIMDLGPLSLNKFGKIIKDSKTIVWNGPMGVFEFPAFAKGTFSMAKIVAESNAVTIVGGGDSAAALKESGLSDKITHISTGGGASLKMLEGSVLPGLEALDDR